MKTQHEKALILYVGTLNMIVLTNVINVLNGFYVPLYVCVLHPPGSSSLKIRRGCSRNFPYTVINMQSRSPSPLSSVSFLSLNSLIVTYIHLFGMHCVCNQATTVKKDIKPHYSVFVDALVMMLVASNVYMLQLANTGRSHWKNIGMRKNNWVFEFFCGCVQYTEAT